MYSWSCRLAILGVLVGLGGTGGCRFDPVARVGSLDAADANLVRDAHMFQDAAGGTDALHDAGTLDSGLDARHDASLSDGGPLFVIWVSETRGDDDSGDGSLASPYRSIDRGIAAAAPGSGEVRIIEGTYREEVSLAEGVRLVGGYHEDGTFVQDAAITVIESNSGKGLVAQGLHSGSLSYLSFDVSGHQGRSAYGVFVVSSSGIDISHVRIAVTGGLPGSHGQSPSPGDSGGSGAVGDNGCNEPSCSRPQGGAGGASPCGAIGGAGGQGGRPHEDEIDGDPGANGAGGPTPPNGAGGAGGGGGDDGHHDGHDGQAGKAGDQGADGTGGGQVGSCSAAGYLPADGTDGANGGHGGGGGGGGGGWAKDAFFGGNDDDYFGAGGGGGGGGGCGGMGAGGGKGGGASVGIYLFASQVALQNCFVVTGSGGSGGDADLVGGDGGFGGPGGAGGAGNHGGGGGKGGEGGAGGNGGGGGGGGGGPSVGVLMDSTSSLVPGPTNLQVNAGPPGFGGTGADPGQDGYSGDILSCP